MFKLKYFILFFYPFVLLALAAPLPKISSDIHRYLSWFFTRYNTLEKPMELPITQIPYLDGPTVEEMSTITPIVKFNDISQSKVSTKRVQLEKKKPAVIFQLPSKFSGSDNSPSNAGEITLVADEFIFSAYIPKHVSSTVNDKSTKNDFDGAYQTQIKGTLDDALNECIETTRGGKETVPRLYKIDIVWPQTAAREIKYEKVFAKLKSEIRNLQCREDINSDKLEIVEKYYNSSLDASLDKNAHLYYESALEVVQPPTERLGKIHLSKTRRGIVFHGFETTMERRPPIGST
ncbi:hypothetical protein NUU61_004629 [Penicillium alfredii]|uniref:Uncharacterized protein n=1 Tax=Penicillium alfredii TaxID=1506179 RepID=A0A9W9KET4_9EURO|nr:uncharacterized protein NUU61_004629 [Penicillium alfredii]KAJ5102407.1 hypothetical protein NUU61_004629 [Penicillium alfredii]